MDLGKDHSHVTLHQTPDLHQDNHTPEVTGTWCLRNREQLRKRKAEAQDKRTSQWLFGEQKKGKRQRTDKGNGRGRKRQRPAELQGEPWPLVEKEVTEGMEPPGGVTKAHPPEAAHRKTGAEECASEIRQESIMHQGTGSAYQETGAQGHPSETHHDMAAPEDLSPQMCQETAVPQDHPSRIDREMDEPEDLSSKMCQGTTVPAALPSEVPKDTAGPHHASPEEYPKPDVPKGYPLETDQTTAETEEESSEPGQGTAEMEGFLPEIHGVAVSKDLSAKTNHETIESEYETTVPKAPSPKATQEIPAPEDYSLEIYQEKPGPEEDSPEVYQETARSKEYSPEPYQETSGPEDLSTKIYTNEDVPKECFPVPSQEAGGPGGQGPIAHREDAKDVFTFPQEMKEKPKAEEPEIPANLDSSQETHPENDIFSYVLF
ncbi:hemogen [Orycteropus afer afer]|uniref:Hemogen n=1 Tax=Orycteropus afer afer TaxID=1230840 RepID=A0A8B7BCJ8_ORYAF|nr:hemogen [Orycteropus afer afer]